jgi:benzoyl-CoA reductase/2-hydroxyglutaryl-CoA dehydratase subunit BcrC/BadD/HgdB
VLEKEKGIKKAKEIYQTRLNKAKEYKKEGKKILGYLCLYAPLEMITALQIIPFRIYGNIFEIPIAVDRYLPQSFCPYIRNIFDLSLKGKYDFLDGIVWTHSCDAVERTGRIWESVINYPFFHFMDLPTKVSLRHQKFFKEGLDDLKKSLEELTKRKLLIEELKEAILNHNEQRFLVRSIYEHTKKSPPKISYSEILQIIGAITSIPVEEGNKLLKEILIEIENRKSDEIKGPRLLIWGSVVDPSFIEIIENLRCHIVIDDLCIGTKGYWRDIKFSDDLIRSIANYYLTEIKCPRTFKEASREGLRKRYSSDLEERFGYLKEFIHNWRVNGAILQTIQYCDCYGFEIPQVKDYFDSLGVPSILLEHSYNTSNRETLKTKIEAFLEMIQYGIK